MNKEYVKAFKKEIWNYCKLSSINYYLKNSKP